jgi:hypothetical protein
VSMRWDRTGPHTHCNHNDNGNDGDGGKGGQVR